VKQAPTDNADFRRALAYSVNQEVIVKYVTRGGQQPAYAFTPPSEDGYHPPDVIHYDPDKALEFLKKAGYASGADVPEFTIILNTSEAHKSIAVAIQDMWKKTLGIQNVKIENQEWKVFQQTVIDQNYDVARAGWIGDYVDPTTFLGMWVTNDSNNNTGWSSPDYDRLLRESALLSDPAERYAKLAEAESILLDEVPVLPLYWYTRVYLLHPDVKNWNPLLLDNHPYKHIDLQSSKAAEEGAP
jgi:oligopeptide transport system substrate-binding protein